MAKTMYEIKIVEHSCKDKLIADIDHFLFFGWELVGPVAVCVNRVEMVYVATLKREKR